MSYGPVPPNVTPRLIAQYCVDGMINALGFSAQQAYVADAEEYDPDWQEYPRVVVIPGDAAPDGPARGAQEGGNLIRIQRFTFCVYHRSKLDQHEQSEIAMTQPGTGLMDLAEKVRSLFQLSYLGDQSGNPSTCLLCEPMWWEGQSPAGWVDMELGILRMRMTFGCVFWQLLPQVTLTREQINA